MPWKEAGVMDEWIKFIGCTRHDLHYFITLRSSIIESGYTVGWDIVLRKSSKPVINVSILLDHR